MVSTFLEDQHKKQLQEWMNWNEIEFKVLFKGSVHGHTPQAFHNACDNKGPTLVLVKLGKGTLFGGYTSANWDSTNTQVVDNTAFVFQLYPAPKRYPVTAGQNAINKQAASGPIFGTSDLIIYQAGTPPGVNGISSTLAVYPLQISNKKNTVFDEHTFPFIATPGNNAIQANNALASAVPPYGLSDVEVIQVIPSINPEIPIHSYTQIDFTERGVLLLRRDVSNWIPNNVHSLNIHRANVLLVGALGSGKSASINTCITALCGSKGVRHIASSRSSTVSVTRKLAGYDLTRLQSTVTQGPLASLLLIDSAGWSGASYPGMDLLLDGRIPHNNSVLVGDATLFDPRGASILAERDVTFADAVHCVVFVIPYAQLANLSAYCQSMTSLIDEVVTKGISAVGVITGCDADELVKRRGVRAAYSSEELNNARRRVASELKINPGQVYLLKNYQEESQPTLEVDALTLFFLQGVQQHVDGLLDSITLGLLNIRNLPGPSSSKNK